MGKYIHGIGGKRIDPDDIERAYSACAVHQETSSEAVRVAAGGILYSLLEMAVLVRQQRGVCSQQCKLSLVLYQPPTKQGERHDTTFLARCCVLPSSVRLLHTATNRAENENENDHQPQLPHAPNYSVSRSLVTIATASILSSTYAALMPCQLSC